MQDTQTKPDSTKDIRELQDEIGVLKRVLASVSRTGQPESGANNESAPEPRDERRKADSE